MSSEYVGMKQKDYVKFRKRACSWLERLASFLSPHPLRDFVPGAVGDGGGCDGFVVLNGGILSGCGPYDLRELLVEAGLIENGPATEQTFFYSSTMPFAVVTQPLLRLRHDADGESSTNATAPRYRLLSWGRDIAATVKMNGKLPCRGTDKGRVSCDVGQERPASQLSSSSSSVFSAEAAACLDALYVLPVPPGKRIHRPGSSFNAAPTSLFLLPCVSKEGVAAVLHAFFQRWVLGIDALLVPTRSPPAAEMPRRLSCHAFASIPGLYCVPHFLTQDEHDAVLAELDHSRDGLRCQFLARRRVAHFNRKFIYGVNALGEVGEDVNPLPSFYGWMRERLRNTDPSVALQAPYPFSSSTATTTATDDPDTRPPLCDQLTVNYYEYDGGSANGIAAHVDAHSPFGDFIFIVSLGSPTVLEYVSYADDMPGSGTCPSAGGGARVPQGVYVPPRSLIVMTGECRYGWTHCIAERQTDTLCEHLPTLQRGSRVSLTWRKGRDQPHRKTTCPYPQLCDGVG